MIFFALNGSIELGQAIASVGGFSVSKHEERFFAGGEHKSRPLVSVRGKDVYVLLSLNGVIGDSANDKLLRLLFFVATCRENGASRITAIVPYLAYSRKDRQTKPRDPVTTRYVAALFYAVNVDFVVTLDVHNIMAFQNAFRCQTLHLNTRHLFASEILSRSFDGPLAVVSPDSGGVKRAELFRETLEELSRQNIGFGFLEKRRSGGFISGNLFAGDVLGLHVIVIDDMIVGGETMARAARALVENGAKSVSLFAAHGLFSDEAVNCLNIREIDSITVSDSVKTPNSIANRFIPKFKEISNAPQISEIILNLNNGKPLDILP